MKKNYLHKPLIHAFLILVFILLAYSNTFHSPFHFDDDRNIGKNPIIKNLNFFIKPSQAEIYKLYKTFTMRYFGYLTFALNYKIHGLDVKGYHISNLVIHFINSMLVYWLVLLTLETPFFSRIRQSCYSADNPSSPSFLIAFFSALLFAVHPIQTQAVTYIVQRFASLATLFCLLSLTLYVRSRLLKEPMNNSTGTRKEKNKHYISVILLYCVSVLCAIVAMKTKEIAFTLPILTVIYEFIFFEGKIFRRILYLVPLLLTMLIIPLSLTGVEKPFGDLISDISDVSRIQTPVSRLDYFFTECRVILTYLRIIVFPINQNLDYNFPIYHSLFNLPVFLSFLFLFLLLCTAFYFYHTSRFIHNTSRLTAFGIFWFFLTLLVESSIIPIPDVIFEHRMYLPSAGIFIAIVTLSFFIFEKLKYWWKNADKTLIALLSVSVIVLTCATHARNSVWKDELSLWKDVISKSPKNARAYNNLALAYQSEGLIDKAIEQYKIAIKLRPDMPEIHNNLGFLYQSKGIFDKAEEEYLIAIKLNPSYFLTHYNLGLLYQSRGRIAEAIGQYQTSIKLNSLFPMAYNYLGRIYFTQGLIDSATEQYQIAANLSPDIADVHNNLGLAYKSKGMIEEAIKHYKIAIRLNPDVPEFHNNLGNTYRYNGIYDKAIEHFKIALKLKPDWEIAHFNLGQVYLKIGDIQSANKEFEEAKGTN